MRDVDACDVEVDLSFDLEPDVAELLAAAKAATDTARLAQRRGSRGTAMSLTWLWVLLGLLLLLALAMRGWLRSR